MATLSSIVALVPLALTVQLCDSFTTRRPSQSSTTKSAIRPNEHGIGYSLRCPLSQALQFCMIAKHYRAVLFLLNHVYYEVSFSQF